MSTKVLWLLGTLPGGFLFALSVFSGTTFPESTGLLFIFTIAVTLGCAVLALGLLITARKTGLAEIGLFAVGLMAVSLLPLVHGITIPGVIYGPNSASGLGAWGGLPLGIVVASPVLLPKSRSTIWLLNRWRGYTVTSLVIVLGVCALLLAFPNALPAPASGKWWTLFGAACGLVGALSMAARQIKLYEVGGRKASFIAAIGFSYVGLSSLVWLFDDPLSLAAWLAHGFDGFGVLLAAWGLLVAHRADVSVAEIFSPVLNQDPKLALRLGVSPEVQRFLEDLDSKDAQTRGHVVRVAELAMSVGENAGLSGRELRNLGLAAILHDIGKLRVPDFILKKNGSLNESEYEQIKLHTIWGEELLTRDPELVEAGAFVRSHHERLDGRGYPDGLSYSQIPLAVSIISVCDAWDAMVQDRHYRQGLDIQKARSIMLEHSGSQWDPSVVELLLEQLDANWTSSGAFDDLGDTQSNGICEDALPSFA